MLDLLLDKKTHNVILVLLVLNVDLNDNLISLGECTTGHPTCNFQLLLVHEGILH